MGIFRSNYDKPGPGIEKDAPKKRGLFLYLELLKRKFGKLMQATMLYFLCSIPMLIIIAALAIGFTAGELQEIINEAGGKAEELQNMTSTVSVFISVLFLVLWGSGPASAAFSYITRCFTREEHTWIMSDFFQRFKENFKQGIIVSIVDVAVLVFGSNAIYFYFSMAQKSGAMVWMILCYLSLMLILVYTFMHIYIYQIMVTYECKLLDLYKNSLILAFGKAPMNLVLVVLCSAFVFVLFNFLNPLIALIVAFLVYVGFAKFPMEFYAARTINRIFVPTPKEEQ